MKAAKALTHFIHKYVYGPCRCYNAWACLVMKCVPGYSQRRLKLVFNIAAKFVINAAHYQKVRMLSLNGCVMLAAKCLKEDWLIVLR